MILYFCRLNGNNETKIDFPCSVRATWWHCCEAVAFWEVPRYCDVIRRLADERLIKYPLSFFFFENGKLGLSTYCYM